MIGVPGREGFLITEAIRGEGATLHDAARRALRRRARAARRGRARDPARACAQTGSRSVASTCARSTRRYFPNVVAALREAGLDPDARAVPVAPAAHYMMGGIVTDLHAPLDARRACTRSASPRARACTAPTGWPRTRSASASCSRAARSPTRSPSPPRPAPRAERARARGAARRCRARRSPTPRRARRCGATPASSARARACERLLGDPHPLARLIARCALARDREPRRAPARATTPSATPRSTAATSVVAGDGERRAGRRWALSAPTRRSDFRASSSVDMKSAGSGL